MKHTNPFPIVLVILDGFGHSDHKAFNAVYHAKMPHFKHWLEIYPYTLLAASGKAVGLLPGMIGNSEVGHLTIGAGRIIPQEIVRVLNAIDDKSFFDNPVLIQCLEHVKKTTNRLHLMGLLSDAGVHSHEKILYALIKAAAQKGIEHVFVHAFLDGRDVPPESANTYLLHLDRTIKDLNCGTLATMHGRYYAMDRDHNWERTAQSYYALTQPETLQFSSWKQALAYYYQQNITDEFIPPTQFTHDGLVQEHDTIIFFNIRADRARQLTQAFIDPHFDHFSRRFLDPALYTMTEYDKHFDLPVFFKPPIIKHTLKDILQQHNKTMFTIAETEKYAHVTYFFDGGNEKQYPNETRIMIPSVALKNYIECPQMSAQGITDAVIHSLQHNPKDFYLINYANADMVGHSGNFEATVKAIEFLDVQLERLYKEVIDGLDGTLIITADHGNAEDMFDEKTQQPKTSHTTNPVYFLVIQKGLEHQKMHLPLQGLADIARFILELMGIER